MPVETSLVELVAQLSRVGIRPDERLVRHILAHGEAARPALIELASQVDVLHEDLPASVGPLHALRLLGELPDVSMILPLFAQLPIQIYDAETDVIARIYATEVLQIIARIGVPAVAELWAIADNPEETEIIRGIAITALAYVATFAPETRDDILQEVRKRFAADDKSSLSITTGLVTVLADLGDSASYNAVMAAYRAGQVDQTRSPAAQARQMLLAGGRGDLTCVNHPLWERYDQHGPSFQVDGNR